MKATGAPGECRAAVLAYIRQYIVKCGFAPTVREIARGVGLGSTSVVNYHLNRLVRAGLLERHPWISRGLAVPDLLVLGVGDEVWATDEHGERVRVRVVEPVARAA